jgi:dTDP-glucose 4,6-dehydratase
MRILITGGCGFIGSHLVQHFASIGHEVIVADLFSYAGKAKRIQNILPMVEVLVGDLAQGDLPYRCIEAEPHIVIHAAAETHVDRSIMDPTTFLRSNAIGTSRLLDAFANRGCVSRPRFLVYSTDEVYGPQNDWSHESLRLEGDQFNPSNSYSASKVAVEAICNAFRVTHGLPIVIVRPCNVYGRGQHPEKAIPRWISTLLKGEKAPLFRGGKEFRDWMHTSDHARAIETILLKWEWAEDFKNINIPRGDWRTNAEVLRTIIDILYPAQVKSFEDYVVDITPRKGHDPGYAMWGGLLGSLGFVSKMSFEDGLRDQIEWTKANPDFWSHDLVGLAR